MDTYISAVTEARTLVKRSEADQWRLAQLTYENAAPFGRNGKKSLAQWAEDIGVHSSYAERLYKVWKTAGQDRSADDVGTSFSDVYNEISPSSAYQPRVGQVEAVREALNDPKVAQEVFADAQAKTQAVNAIREASREEKPGSFKDAPTLLDVVTDAADIKHRIRAIARKIVALSPDNATKEEILQDVAEWEVEIDQIKNFLTGMNMDEVISKILEGV